MNFHSDKWIMDHVREHYNEALEYFPEDRIVCLSLAGSQNYGLDMEDSDVDTKLIVTPQFDDIVINKQPVSTTHIRQNGEHISFHDIRLYIPTFRKGNVNFVETLFSKYVIVNPIYENEWNRLVQNREEIARYNIPRAVLAMRGTVHTKYKQIVSPSDIREKAIEKFGYSPKEFYQLCRAEEFIERYINGEPYADCLVSKQRELFQSIKNGNYTAGDALWMAKVSFDRTTEMCDKFLESCNKAVDKAVDALLDDVQYNIMKIAIKKEIGD
jgi:hypothetical protein